MTAHPTRGADDNRRIADDDLRLQANVHPQDWLNPRPRARYHLLVIGGGTGGLVTAAIAATLGARVALIERALMGGDCLNVGCVPSKALLATAREARGGGEAGFADAMRRMRRIRADISEHDSARRFRDLGVDVYFGHATFTAPDRVEVGGETLRFRRAVVATGTRPAIPPIPGVEGIRYLTNETVFSLGELPPRLLIIGAGPIGCELAQAFTRLGSHVTLLEAGDRILPNDDADAAGVVADALRREGIELVCGARITKFEPAGTGCRAHFEAEGAARVLQADELLIAAGRTPNTDGLGLDLAGIRADPAIGIVTDERLRTTNPAVYAIGDVASTTRFTHVADAHARMVVRNALFFGRSKVDDLTIPWCTYTDPELAHVGMPPAQLGRETIRTEEITVRFDQVDRARLEARTEGFLRVHLRPGTDEIVAATVVGPHAGEIIGQLAHAIGADVGLEKLGETILPYPTRGEIVRKAADQWRRRKLTPRAERAFRMWFRLMR